jgi:2'-5' RNA ligase
MESTLLLLGYPVLDAPARNRLVALRRQHDARNADRVEPHFTLVFRVAGIDEAALLAHAGPLCDATEPIDFILRCALVVPEDDHTSWCVFLVPDKGFSSLVHLHDRLYTGPLAAHLRLDIPFVPHLTVARTTDAPRAKELADAMNAERFAIRGQIDELTLVRLSGTRLVSRARLPLRG